MAEAHLIGLVLFMNLDATEITIGFSVSAQAEIGIFPACLVHEKVDGASLNQINSVGQALVFDKLNTVLHILDLEATQLLGHFGAICFLMPGEAFVAVRLDVAALNVTISPCPLGTETEMPLTISP